MRVEIPDVRVGEPMRCGGVTVFPLFTGLPMFPAGDGTLNYVLAHEAMSEKTVAVQEVSEEGEVPFLLVDNCGDQPVLFIEGTEVCGGKQNRVLCSSILMPGRSRTRIPVVCTQFKRWEFNGRQFAAGSHCPPSLRHVLKDGHRPDQSRIWRTIRNKHHRLGVRSQSENLSDALEAHREKADQLKRNLPYPEGALGIVVALGGKIVSADIFDKPTTLQKLWGRFLDGFLLDALDISETQPSNFQLPVRLYMEMVRDMRWRTTATVGLGEAYHARGDDDTLGTTLVVDGVPVHVSVSMGD